MAYYDFLNIVFAPILKLPLLAAIIIISLLFTAINLFITKFFSDQPKIKRIREESDKLRADMKELRKDPSKTELVQKKMMEMNKLAMEQMRMSFKPMIISSIPFLLLLIPWMNSAFSYESVHPQQTFTVTATFAKGIDGNAAITAPDEIKVTGNKTKKIENGMVTWTLKGEEGTHALEFNYDTEKQYKEVLITDSKKYILPEKLIKNSPFTSLKINNNKLVVLPVGYKDWFGWLGTYILLSIAFALAMRKIFKIY